ncbi:Uncharacterized protein DBV15_07240 [Temnothorax longispinosus]|uniref:Uncharacterized protein n=1 Tax=Temnothorax longispinosus TaxID=300112 RepID=A0A4S2JJ87_9HYME|nr:Uncharacterized protein DBV15_07240 [Temnothorax longispinosus]
MPWFITVKLTSGPDEASVDNTTQTFELAFILYVTREWLTVGNYLVELCQDRTRDPIGCTLIEYRSDVVATVQRTFTDTRFKKGGRAEEERTDRKEGAAEEEVINGNEDCLAKCEWPASEDIDGRMDGWTGGSVWTDGHCIGHRRHRRRVASVRNPNVFNVQRSGFFLSFSVSSETG